MVGREKSICNHKLVKSSRPPQMQPSGFVCMRGTRCVHVIDVFVILIMTLQIDYLIKMLMDDGERMNTQVETFLRITLEGKLKLNKIFIILNI